MAPLHQLPHPGQPHRRLQPYDLQLRVSVLLPVRAKVEDVRLWRLGGAAVAGGGCRGGKPAVAGSRAPVPGAGAGGSHGESHTEAPGSRDLQSRVDKGRGALGGELHELRVSPKLVWYENPESLRIRRLPHVCATSDGMICFIHCPAPARNREIGTGTGTHQGWSDRYETRMAKKMERNTQVALLCL
jgi:hypothetical protein